MNITIIDMPTDEASIQRAGEILTLAFAENFTDAWNTLEESIEEVREILDDDYLCRAALVDGQIVGWIGGIPEYDGNVWELHPLAIHPEYQRQGVGRALVRDLETLVAERGAYTITLGSDDQTNMTTLANVDLYDNLWQKIEEIQNLKGHPCSFYQRLGYTIIGVIPDANGLGKPDIIMGKRIQK